MNGAACRICVYDRRLRSPVTFASATWSQPCLRVSDDGSDWSDSLPYFSCPAHTGRRPTALPRTIVWLPQPRPHRREAIGSIVLICRVRSNAGTCGCSGNLSKKQVHGTGPRLLRTRLLRTRRFARDFSARDCFARRCFRWPVDPPAVDINTGCWVTRDRKVHKPGRQRVTLAGCRQGRFSRWTAIEGQRGCASGRNLRANRTGRRFFTVNRTDKGSKLQRASGRRSGGRAAPARSRRVAHPGIRSPAGGGEQGRCERAKRPDGQSRSGCRCERRDRECRPRRRRSGGTSRMGQLAVLIFLSFGLPGAGILAWVVMRADNVRGEQLAGTHLHATGADDRRSENKRRARGLDDRREAAWLDDFLAHLAEHPTTGVRNAGVASVGPVQPRADVTEAVLRNILRAFRHKVAAEYDSGSYATAQRRMAAR